MNRMHPGQGGGVVLFLHCFDPASPLVGASDSIPLSRIRANAIARGFADPVRAGSR